jgi:hypothetical protein
VLLVWLIAFPMPPTIVPVAGPTFRFLYVCTSNTAWIFVGVEIAIVVCPQQPAFPAASSDNRTQTVLLLTEVAFHLILRDILPKLFWGELSLLPVQIYGSFAIIVVAIVTRVLFAPIPNFQVCC